MAELAKGTPLHTTGGKTSMEPRVRPEHQGMLEALHNAQNYIRDADGSVIPTPSTMSTATISAQLPQPQPDSVALNTKAHAAAADDHERRQDNNPYHLPPHLRPREPQAAATTSTGKASQAGNGDPSTAKPKPSTASSSTDAGLPPADQSQRKTGVRFQLPADHRENPPKPARRKTVLWKLTDSASVQLRIDGLLNNQSFCWTTGPRT